MSTLTTATPTPKRTSDVPGLGRKARAGGRLLLSSLAALFLASSAGPATAQAVQPKAAVPAATASPLIASDATGDLWGYSSTGNSRLGSRALVSEGLLAKQIISVDWNDDGIQDIVARLGNGTLTLSTGQVAGSYRPAVVIGTGWQRYEITATKLRRADSYPGILARDTISGKLHYYPNVFGGPLSTPRITLGTAGWAPMTQLKALDFDRDGGMDVLARNRSGAYVLYRGTGMGSFVNERRRAVGSGWNPMSGIATKSGFAGPGTVGLIARNSTGQLYYYPVTSGRFGTPRHLGNGWNGYTIADGTAPAAAAGPRSVYAQEYAKSVYNYVKNWCPKARVLNHPSVTKGDVYGMMWWGSDYLAIRTDIPQSITKSIALHECGHMLQAKAYGVGGKSLAVARMKAIYGGSGTYGLEQNADCIAAYLSPRSAPSSVGASSEARFWSVSCTGYKGEAAKRILSGRRP